MGQNTQAGQRTGTHEPDAEIDELARQVIGACIEVHQEMGPGLHESCYENALAIEFELRGIPFQRQHYIKIQYKGRHVGKAKPDFKVGGRLIVEIKAIETVLPVHEQKVKTYIKADGECLGLLINFNVCLLKQGITRIVWTS